LRIIFGDFLNKISYCRTWFLTPTSKKKIRKRCPHNSSVKNLRTSANNLRTTFFLKNAVFYRFLNDCKNAIFGDPVETAKVYLLKNNFIKICLLKVCAPSLIYNLQNNLYYVALSNLESTTFCVWFLINKINFETYFEGHLSIKNFNNSGYVENIAWEINF